jgi:hypothetical protein
MEGVWSESLQCNWLRWEILDEYTLKLFLPEMNRCDKNGCVETGTSLMPKVRRIITYVGNSPDREFVKRD